MTKQRGPQFIKYFRPILEVLKELGGSGTASEVMDHVIEKMQIPESEQEVLLKSGQSRVRNRIQWARFYLAHAGYIDSSKRGIWTITEEGISLDLAKLDAFNLFQKIHKKFTGGKKTEVRIEKEAEEVYIDTKDYRSKLINLIKSLSPDGFERLSKRLLRESGFQQVVVTGKAGDGGIDGYGVLQVNPFVSFNVLFQCKRYQGAVTASQIRDFRGAMMGRTDKGLIITTGTFTAEAKKEARREGVPPIELVDGDMLVQLFENLQLGLIPRTTYDVDEKFFDEFKN